MRARGPRVLTPPAGPREAARPCSAPLLHREEAVGATPPAAWRGKRGGAEEEGGRRRGTSGAVAQILDPEAELAAMAARRTAPPTSGPWRRPVPAAVDVGARR